MDIGRYRDFDGDIPNVVWNFVEDEGKFTFRQYHLNHARLGDSDSVYCSIPASITTDADELIDISDGIVDYVNDSYPAFIKHVFNCPESRVSEISSNREIVASSIFVVSKKRYAARVIDDEGKRVDKLKIMGLEVKRSDTPEAVQRYLLDLINMILDDASRHDIEKAISKMKEQYQNEDIKSIARPMSCKGLKIYQDKLDVTGSTKGFPYQVRAAMFYNSLCSSTDKKIMPGDKIGIVYIKDRRSKYIAFPVETNDLPQFIYDVAIDYDMMWSKASKKIDSYMQSIGYDFDSLKNEVRKDLFGF